MKFRFLNQTQQQNFAKKLYGFDVETTGKKNNFYMGSIVSEIKEYGWGYKKHKIFFDQKELVNEFKKERFKNSTVVATNLQFDFNSVFYDKQECEEFMPLFRGSNPLFYKSHIFHKEFFIKSPKKLGLKSKPCSITFIDTKNYANLSVKDLGSIINYPKLKSPKCLGRFPKNNEEKQELINYNIRDSEISLKGLRYLYDSFIELGATPKVTIASTSMSLFKNKYLDKIYWVHSVPELLEIFKGYYGGRTEAFSRGFFQDHYYYDFNSLYPSVMLNEFPNPNSLRVTKSNDYSYIMNFEGMSKVKFSIPETKYPLLPYRYNEKLLFPFGIIKGWFTHVEIRKARQLGYTLLKSYKTYYYKENCLPFYDFVKDLYSKRKKYQEENSKMEYVVKIIMNSLYGKFGQRFTDRENLIPVNEMTKDLLETFDFVERIGKFFRVKKDFSQPPMFCFPIWSAYITAYARIKLHEFMEMTNPIYVDTDSLITKEKIESSNQLGKLKLEHIIRDGVIVKPKFYMFTDTKEKDKCKIKGYGASLMRKDFLKILKNPVAYYTKFVKLKEALRRNLTPNEIIEIRKCFDLEDNKRQWNQTFNFTEFQDSKPLKIHNGNAVLMDHPLQ